MVNWVHPLFLKAKATTIKVDNNNWRQATNGNFYYEYWKAYCKYIETLELMEALENVDISEEINVIE